MLQVQVKHRTFKNVFFVLLGYQKTKAEEAKILESLREEGLLAKPKGKTAGGMAFEVVDSSVVEKQQDFEGGKDAFVTAEFMPSKTLKRLELRRGVSCALQTTVFYREYGQFRSPNGTSQFWFYADFT